MEHHGRVAMYRPLSDIETAKVLEGLRLAAHLLGPDLSANSEGLQELYDALLDTPSRPASAVEALGFAFGEMLLEQDWLEWAMLLDDEYGDEISIAVADRQLGCSPLSMIRNRLEDGEVWDLAGLRDTTVKRLRQLGQQAAPT